jgi:hypothetical protein
MTSQNYKNQQKKTSKKRFVYTSVLTLITLFIWFLLIWWIWCHITEKNNSLSTRIGENGITIHQIPDDLRAKIDFAVAAAGALPVNNKSFEIDSCLHNQVLAYNTDRFVCMDMTTGQQVSIGSQGAQGRPGVNGSNGTQGVKGDPGVISVNMGNGISGSLASQILNLDIVIDPSGGLSNSSNGLSLIASCTNGQILRFISGSWVCGNDNDTDTQDLSVSSNILSLVNGGSVDLTPYLDNTDSQALSWDNGTRSLSLVNGGSVIIPDVDTTYTAGTGITITPGTQINATLGTDINSAEIVDGTIVNADLATNSVNSSNIVDGTVTSTDITDGTVTGTDLATNTVTSSNITDGTITSTDLATTGVSAGTYGSGTVIPVITVNAQGQLTSVTTAAIPTASTSTTGLLTSTDWNTFNGKENVLTFNGNGLFTRTGNTVTGLACTAGQITKWTGASFACGADNDTTYSSGNGITLTGTTFSVNSPTCAGTTKLQWNGTAFVCSADVDTTNFNISANAGATQNIASGNTVNFNNGTGTTATRTGNDIAYGLTNTGVTAGTYGTSTTVPVITVDAQGRLTTVTSQSIAFPSEVDGIIGNEVTNVTGANSGLVRSGSGTTISPYTLAVSVGNGIQLTSGNVTINSPTCAGTTKLQWNGTAFVCSTDVDTTYTAGTGITITPGTQINATLGTDINSAEIVDGTIVNADLATNSVNSSNIVDGTVTSTDITDGTVTGTDLATNTVTSSNITDGTITSTDLANYWSIRRNLWFWNSNPSNYS